MDKKANDIIRISWLDGQGSGKDEYHVQVKDFRSDDPEYTQGKESLQGVKDFFTKLGYIKLFDLVTDFYDGCEVWVQYVSNKS